MTMPVRLQLSRKRGAKLVSPNGLPLVICDRRGKWGNPYRMGEVIYLVREGRFEIITPENCLVYFKRYARDTREQARRELRGKNLACWCDLSNPCHCDIWLEIANE